MIIILKIILITSIWCLGIKISTAKGMIFEKMGNWAQQKVDAGNNIYQTLLTCPWCMPSVHSLIGFLFAIGLGIVDHISLELLIMWPLIIMGASVMTGLIWAIYEAISQIHKYFKYLNDGN